MRVAAISRMFILFLCFPFLKFISLGSAQNVCDNGHGNYTANSTYSTNLNTLLSSLSSDTQIDYGFYNFSYGENSNIVNAIGLCRGDLEPEECRSCLNDSRVDITQACPNQKKAILWSEKCMLRYSNDTIFHKMETSPGYYMWNANNVTEPDQFSAVLDDLMKNVTGRAASGDSRRKYATAENSTAINFQTVYGLVQCTPDLSQQECNQCLEGAISEIPTCCNGKQGGRVLRPSCNIRFETYSFYETATTLDPDPEAPPPSTNTTSSEESGNTTIIVIAIVVATVVVVILLICLLLYLRRRKARKDLAEEDEDEDGIKIAESLQFNFDTIRVATEDFSDSNKLGQGGFGAVYRGRLSNGQMIAVKRLSRDSGQGDVEFKNEVVLVVKLQHRNLVRLLGFCLEGRERLLVYEFVPNKSLDYFIFDPAMKAQLDWEKRYQIIRGIARGLLYLHEDSQLRIIHRDLKASNILLDEEMNPKIADFGMARLVLLDQTQANTSRIVGTYGYMAPEYAMHGQFSVKSDVFSFGVLILEIVSGQKNSGINNGENMEDLLSFAWRNWKEGKALNIIDPSLNNNSRNEILRCIHIGLLCVQENLIDRPTMATIILMLNSYSLSLPIPAEPAFYMNSRTRSFPEMQSWEYNSRERGSSEPILKSAQESENEASITELYPR
ncbi:cysteine-rich receptor-like protein kinase 44 isoform X2 [Vigna umbellata]|uniref:cysteine-rich receptor-like protein kinase 44 isoform X2 n=1 Tax=Vigna umbellata TaxID=87088 RepID=UPI001F5F4C11|nr:cysteine-rich receptor-like protein kinase 44 isoform X2 [Vigna umbellata]